MPHGGYDAAVASDASFARPLDATSFSLPQQRVADDQGSDERLIPGEFAGHAPLAAWSRRWGFHVEVVVSLGVAVGLAATLHNDVINSVLVLALWAFLTFHRARTVRSPVPRQLRRVLDSVALPMATAGLLVALQIAAADFLAPVAVALTAGAAVSALCRVARWRLQSPVRVLVVGDAFAIAQAANRWNSGGKIRTVAGVLVDPESVDQPSDIMGVPTVTRLERVVEMAERWQADLVVAAPGPGFTSAEFRSLAWALESTRFSLGVLGVLDSVAPHRIIPGSVDGATVVDVRMPRPAASTRALKAIFDRVAGGLLLLVAAPVIAAMWLAVRLDTSGPGFFKQTRVGRNNKTFEVYKMRTMGVDADAQKAALEDSNEFDSVLFKMKHDPRVTRVGALLRKSSLDELPQLINVVRGEMSLVGPRPNLPSEVALMDERTLRRLAVKPGITGLWQVSGRSDLPFDKACELDTYYADNWSIGGDLMILLRTVGAVVAGRGAY